jgi:hypothetical protein
MAIAVAAQGVIEQKENIGLAQPFVDNGERACDRADAH